MWNEPKIKPKIKSIKRAKIRRAAVGSRSRREKSAEVRQLVKRVRSIDTYIHKRVIHKTFTKNDHAVWTFGGRIDCELVTRLLWVSQGSAFGLCAAPVYAVSVWGVVDCYKKRFTILTTQPTGTPSHRQITTALFTPPNVGKMPTTQRHTMPNATGSWATVWHRHKLSNWNCSCCKA